jgi:hypothetical protein
LLLLVRLLQLQLLRCCSRLNGCRLRLQMLQRQLLKV